MLLHKGEWFSFKTQTMNSGEREYVVRNNGEYFACKVLPLFLSEEAFKKLKITSKGKCSLHNFAKMIAKKQVQKSLKVQLIAIERVVTYIEEFHSSEKFVLELPGGVVKNGEKPTIGGVRELVEEVSVSIDQVVAFANLLPAAPFDSSAHGEFMGLAVALCVGEAEITPHEGIIPELCPKVPFTDISKFLQKKRKKKIIVEGYVPSALALLRDAIHDI